MLVLCLSRNGWAVRYYRTGIDASGGLYNVFAYKLGVSSLSVAVGPQDPKAHPSQALCDREIGAPGPPLPQHMKLLVSGIYIYIYVCVFTMYLGFGFSEGLGSCL